MYAEAFKQQRSPSRARKATVFFLKEIVNYIEIKTNILRQ